MGAADTNLTGPNLIAISCLIAAAAAAAPCVEAWSPTAAAVDGADGPAPDAGGVCVAAAAAPAPAAGHTNRQLIDLTGMTGMNDHPAPAAADAGADIAAAAVYLQDTGTAWRVIAGWFYC